MLIMKEASGVGSAVLPIGAATSHEGLALRSEVRTVEPR